MSISKIIYFSPIILINLFSACNNKPVDRNAFKKEMENREVMRVTPGQLNNFALKKGKLILDSLQSANLMDDDSILSNLPFKLWLESEMNFRISTLSETNIDKKSKLFTLFDAYKYNVENNISSEDNLQKIGEDTICYSRPIFNKNTKKLDKILIVKMPKKDLIMKMTIKDLKE